MKKCIALLLTCALAFAMVSPALAEQPAPEPSGKDVYQMLAMYYWMLAKLDDTIPYSDMLFYQGGDGRFFYDTNYVHCITFPDSHQISSITLYLHRAPHQENAWHHQSYINLLILLFAMEHSFGDAAWMQQPLLFTTEALKPTANAILEGVPYASGEYVYYFNIDEEDGVESVKVKHIDLYSAEHPEFWFFPPAPCDLPSKKPRRCFHEKNHCPAAGFCHGLHHDVNSFG